MTTMDAIRVLSVAAIIIGAIFTRHISKHQAEIEAQCSRRYVNAGMTISIFAFILGIIGLGLSS